MLKYLFLLLPIVGYTQTWKLKADYPAPCTSLSFDSQGNEYVARQQGIVLRNGQEYYTVPVHYENESGLDGILSDSIYLYLHYSGVDNIQRVIRLDTVSGSSHTILSVPYINPTSTRHRGGGMAISDGVLYCGFGYGGDPSHAQDLSDFRGKIIAVFLDSEIAYIHAWGVRNPFKISAHPTYDEIWFGDPGGYDIGEEVNVAVDGDNLGFPCWETDVEVMDTCGPTAFPIFSYPYEAYSSVIGGCFYQKDYLWTDFYSGEGGRIDSLGDNTTMYFPESVTAMAVNPHNSKLYALTWEGRLYEYQDSTLLDIDSIPEKKERDKKDYWAEELLDMRRQQYGNTVFTLDWKALPGLPNYSGAYYKIAEQRWVIIIH